MLVLFDLDGTLVDSLEGWLNAYRKALHPRDFSDSKLVEDFFVHHARETFSEYGISDAEAFYKAIDAHLKNEPSMWTAIEHVDETLHELKRRGHTLGILTSRRKTTARSLCPQSILKHASVFLDRNDVKPKPAPDGIYEACRLTGLQLSETVFIGDHETDFGCAASAGVPFFWFKTANDKFWRHQRMGDGVKSFSNFKELPTLIENLG
jgi:HAD superfamily hydrolase (TIGR01509 family)